MKKMRRVPNRSRKKIILITDNARYHHALLHKEWRKEKEQQTFFLNFLPPYSPELNPIERAWKLTRRLCLHNQYFDCIDAIIESVKLKFDEWKYGNETLRKLCAIN
jgi:transposase